MKKSAQFLVSILLVVSSINCYSQNFDPFIEDVIQGVNLDSLVSYVRILSGEDSVTIDGNRELIKSRSSFQASDRALSAQYLLEKLESFGLPTQEHIYSNSGNNIIATQTGTESPDKIFVICAHYDAVTDYAADDNASGTAAVLEAARLLSEYELPNTILYALWDEEEIGLIGSEEYALDAAVNGAQIDGVINIDMIGWDGDHDMNLEIHSHSIGNSTAISDLLVTVNDLYDLAIVPVVKTPGTPYSDHRSFWDQSYGAVLLIEEYWGGDFNPYYHTVNDKIEIFNMDFFHEASKLAVGSIATMADNNPLTSIKPPQDISYYQVRNHPNPFGTITTLSYYQQQNSRVSIQLLNSFGSLIRTISDEYRSVGEHKINISAEGLSNGLYFVVVNGPNGRETHKITVIR